MPGRRFHALALALATAFAAPVAAAHEDEITIRGPADAYVYQLAAPGTYDLPAIKPAADGVLLDTDGERRRLHDLLPGRLTLMSFIYTRCADVCPLATVRLADLRDLVARDEVLARRVRLLSVSFDPAYDTPAVMAKYARSWRSEGATAPPWLFLTPPDADSLAPLLAAYDQPVAEKPEGEAAEGPLSHLLRVFLIDAEGRIRNIYSADFLDPRLVMNDILTLVEAERSRAAGP